MFNAKTIKLFLLIVIGLFLLAMSLKFAMFKLIYRPSDVEYCKTFLETNKCIREIFGEIKEIKVVVPGSGRRFKAGHTYGEYSFKVLGTKARANVKVRWNGKEDSFKIESILMRVGLFSKRVIWPETKATLTDYILPSHVWDGIILLSVVPFLLFFYVNTKREGNLVKFIFPIITWSERGRGVMRLLFLFGVLVSLTQAVLCFLNFTTLF